MEKRNKLEVQGFRGAPWTSNLEPLEKLEAIQRRRCKVVGHNSNRIPWKEKLLETKSRSFKRSSIYNKQDHQRWGYSTVERFQEREKKKKSDKAIFWNGEDRQAIAFFTSTFAPLAFPKISLRFPKDFPKISSRFPQDFSEISPRFPQDFHKISTRFPQDF